MFIIKDQRNYYFKKTLTWVIILSVDYSAYGNVGLSMCYSCQRQIKGEGNCREEWYGFVGSWTNNGKYLLMLVMVFGRLKNFNKNGGRFWNVL